MEYLFFFSQLSKCSSIIYDNTINKKYKLPKYIQDELI